MRKIDSSYSSFMITFVDTMIVRYSAKYSILQIVGYILSRHS